MGKLLSCRVEKTPKLLPKLLWTLSLLPSLPSGLDSETACETAVEWTGQAVFCREYMLTKTAARCVDVLMCEEARPLWALKSLAPLLSLSLPIHKAIASSYRKPPCLKCPIGRAFLLVTVFGYDISKALALRHVVGHVRQETPDVDV